MGKPSSCTVSFLDADHVRHSVEVTAESLFEASVLALKAFRTTRLMDSSPGSAAVLEVKVSAPAVTHTVSLRFLQDWLKSGGKSLVNRR